MMYRSNLVLLIGLFLSASCNRSKTEPVSLDTLKTVVMVDRTKISADYNRRKDLQASSDSGPCAKCLIRLIKKSDGYKAATQSVQSADILYIVNRVPAKNASPQTKGTQAEAGIRIDIIQKVDSQQLNLSTYLFNIATSRLYELNNGLRYEPDPVQIDSLTLKKIRSSCFFEAASAK